MTDIVERTCYRQQAPLALVIGCGDMGTGIAHALGRRHPLLIVDIDDERLQRVVATLQSEGYYVAGQRCDITDAAQVALLASELATGPGVKVLAHVAALGNSPLGWKAVMDVDLAGAHRVARVVAPHLVRGGVAIFISSGGARLARKSAAIDALLDDPLQAAFHRKLAEACGGEPQPIEAYFMAKRGLNRLAETLAVEWSDREVRSLSLSPGYIDSTMARTGGAMLPAAGSDGTGALVPRAEKLMREVPLRRHGTLLEVVEVVDFLASDRASYITGVDIAVDGGHGAKTRYGFRRKYRAPSIE